MLPAAYITFRTPPIDVTCQVISASIRHGRDDPTSQPEASTATLQVLGAPPLSADIGTVVAVYATLPGHPGYGQIARFGGTITDLTISWDTPDQPISQVVATGELARMGNRIVGRTDYPAQTDGQRAFRAITDAGVRTNAARTDPGTLTVCPRPTDPQTGMQVAHEAAEDGGGVLWQTKEGEVVYADARRHLTRTPIMSLDPCAMPLDIAWNKNLEGMVNDLTLSYGGCPAPPAAALGPTIASYTFSFMTELGPDQTGGYYAQPFIPAGPMTAAGGYIRILDTLDLKEGEDLTIGVASDVSGDGTVDWLASGTVLAANAPAPPMPDAVAVLFNTVIELDPLTPYWIVVEGPEDPVDNAVAVGSYTQISIHGCTDGTGAPGQGPVIGHNVGGDLRYGFELDKPYFWTSTNFRLAFGLQEPA